MRVNPSTLALLHGFRVLYVCVCKSTDIITYYRVYYRGYIHTHPAYIGYRLMIRCRSHYHINVQKLIHTPMLY